MTPCRLSAPIRSEIESAAQRAYANGRWDDAIFDAFTAAEAVLQGQLDSTLIGNHLVHLAF